MPTERLVKWSKEAQEFFERAEDDSIVLDLVISNTCASQCGEGFEELVNTINSKEIKRKVKKVIITDTSYLYRHDNPEFAKYADPNIPTQWYQQNKEAIEKLKVETEIKGWSVGLNTKEFKKWYDILKGDLKTRGWGSPLPTDFKFRDKVMQVSSVEAYKNNINIEKCIEFILEEAAYACAFLKGSALVYPSLLAEPVVIAMERYKLNVNHLRYKLSTRAQKHSKRIDKEILSFIKYKVSNANFFVIDEHGNHVYKNYALSGIVSVNAKELSEDSWRNTCEVMRQQKQLSFEEVYKDKTFLSIKSPLILDEKVEGIIGLAVDITDRKKKEELENKLKIEKELYKMAREVAHDICSPITALDIVKRMSEDKLGDRERKMLELTIRKIKEITQKLIERNRGEEDGGGKKDEKGKWIMPSSIKDIIESMKYKYERRGITFDFKEEDVARFAWIKGELSSFIRMITNVIENGVEAIDKKEGKIEVRETLKGEEIEIRVKDNGTGMSKEMIEKIKKGEEVGTTKDTGHGIGMGQIRETIKNMGGKLEIESKEGEGTEFIMSFRKTESPKWFKEQIEIKKGEEIVVLDDELLMHEVWKGKLKEYEKYISLKFFTQGIEALEYLNSLENKEKVFLIADYKLGKQEMTGIDVIDKSGMKERHIIVTNAYLSDIEEFDSKSDYIKIFHKMYFDNITLKLE